MFRLTLAAATVALVATAALAPQAHAVTASHFISRWDTDHDGTLDMAEINRAADAAFTRLDVDHDGTLSQQELGSRVTPAEFAAADTDHDGTLDKTEYLSIVDKSFQAVNKDSDGTVDAAELRTPAGRQLVRLLTAHAA